MPRCIENRRSQLVHRTEIGYQSRVAKIGLNTFVQSARSSSPLARKLLANCTKNRHNLIYNKSKLFVICTRQNSESFTILYLNHVIEPEGGSRGVKSSLWLFKWHKNKSNLNWTNSQRRPNILHSLPHTLKTKGKLAISYINKSQFTPA